MHPRATLFVPEAAWELGICTETAYRQAKRGDLPGAFKFGRRWLVSRDAFERWLASR
jgi:excisionase family DNA binding protein